MSGWSCPDGSVTTTDQGEPGSATRRRSSSTPPGLPSESKAASIDEDCTGISLADQYLRRRPVFFLEEGVCGSIDTAERIGAAWPTDQSRTVVELYAPPGDQEVQAHAGYLRSLWDSGVLLMAGPYNGWRDDPDRSRPTGMVVLAAPEDQARQIAEAGPLFRGGGRYVVR